MAQDCLGRELGLSAELLKAYPACLDKFALKQFLISLRLYHLIVSVKCVRC